MLAKDREDVAAHSLGRANRSRVQSAAQAWQRAGCREVLVLLLAGKRARRVCCLQRSRQDGLSWGRVAVACTSQARAQTCRAVECLQRGSMQGTGTLGRVRPPLACQAIGLFEHWNEGGGRGGQCKRSKGSECRGGGSRPLGTAACWGAGAEAGAGAPAAPQQLPPRVDGAVAPRPFCLGRRSKRMGRRGDLACQRMRALPARRDGAASV